VQSRLLLICQSEGLRNRYAGLAGFEQSDDNSGLTAVGWEQTNSLAQWLKSHERVDVLVSGPQLRSRLTAQRIGQLLGLPVKVRSDVPKYAPHSVRTPNDATDMPRKLSELAHDVAEFDDPTYVSFAEANVAVADLVLQENWGKTVAMVLNGAAIGAITRHFFGAQRLPVSVLHAGVTEFYRRNGQWQCAYVNRRDHLPAPALPPDAQAPAATTSAPAPGDLEELAPVVELYNRLGALPRRPEADADRVQRMRDLMRFAHLPPELRVLDVGTGGGLFALMLAEEGAREVVGIDSSPVMLEVAEVNRMSRTGTHHSHVSFRLAPAQLLPFGDDWFDAVVCRMVLHSTARPERMLQELQRVLRPGGIFLFADLLGADDAVKRATQNAIEERRNAAFVTTRTLEQYRALLMGAGLQIEQEKTATFDRELEEWLSDMEAEPGSRAAVRTMMEAGIETDASGLHVRKQGNKLTFEQRMYYARCIQRN
jgi:ubiquinone/menaquinone biosynthesis C-methylase UbiE/broad specificity phosphatase PhoE